MIQVQSYFSAMLKKIPNISQKSSYHDIRANFADAVTGGADAAVMHVVVAVVDGEAAAA